MNIVPRQLFASSFSCCKAEAPLLYKARTAFSTTARPAAAQKRPAARSWVGRIQAGEKSRRGWNARFQHTWEQIQRVATSPKRSKLSNTAPLLAGIFGAAYIGSAFIPHDQEEDDPAESAVIIDAEQDEASGKIRLAEVTKHDRDSSSKWIIRESKVYDITEFVGQHPGGEIILRACGGSVDPYWKIFSIHEKQEVYDILNQYYIGDIDARDLDEEGHINWDVLGDDATKYVVEDPFQHDPARDENLIFRTEKPCNAETPGNLLTDFLTPLKLFFVRNHYWVPQTHESPQSITIELSDGEESSYSLEDLKAKFKEHTITVTLQCSGNRRAHMSNTKRGATAGLQWDVGAIGTAEFTGVRLRDVLKDAGYGVQDGCPTPMQCEDDDDDKHLHFTSPADAYAVSIPLQNALNPQADVLLAWDMNGEPINRDHGGPIRAIVPGVTAARSVKWVGRVSISSDECDGQFQQRDYKCFGPNRKQSSITSNDWAEAQSIQETPVQSVITNIIKANGTNKTTIQGFAYSGGGRRIVRVDVSADGGQTWRQADLQNDRAKGSKRWAWTLWNIEWPKDELQPGESVEFVVKASDDSYNTQPSCFESTWNFRGLLANAWHRQKREYAEI